MNLKWIETCQKSYMISSSNIQILSVAWCHMSLILTRDGVLIVKKKNGGKRLGSHCSDGPWTLPWIIRKRSDKLCRRNWGECSITEGRILGSKELASPCSRDLHLSWRVTVSHSQEKRTPERNIWKVLQVVESVYSRYFSV